MTDYQRLPYSPIRAKTESTAIEKRLHQLEQTSFALSKFVKTSRSRSATLSQPGTPPAIPNEPLPSFPPVFDSPTISALNSPTIIMTDHDDPLDKPMVGNGEISHAQSSPDLADNFSDAPEDVDTPTSRPTSQHSNDTHAVLLSPKKIRQTQADHDKAADQANALGITTNQDKPLVAPQPLQIIPSDPISHKDDLQPPSPRKRKLRSPFSFFTRNSSSNIVVPTTTRRGTVSSVNSESTRLDEDSEATPKKPTRNVLRDRFKLVRLQEEAGVSLVEDSDGVRPMSSDEQVPVTSPIDENLRPLGPVGQQTIEPSLNQALAPGTAAGTLTGPSPMAKEPVDWDLWQSVVYEGPVAVARTSSDELSHAISQGIPSAIRGVVWQVLAQSKEEGLESMYHDLLNRGKETGVRQSESKPRPADLKKEMTNLSANGNNNEKDVAISVTSSIHSASSSVTSPPDETNAGSPVTSQDGASIEAQAKTQAALLTEERKRLKEEAISLQKLERTIKRDLGARTSYSKFLMSAGLQDGLFGVCKAYALFDEEVGYAQGMNFIAMPLLFNMPEEEAFCLFVRLMNQYHLREMFIPEMPGLHLHLYQFERLLEDFEPAVYCHLHRRGVNPQLYATQWFLTLFAYRFPLQLVLRIYDLILSEGLETAILKFGIVLMQKNASKLLAMKDMVVLTTFLKERLFDVYIDKSPSASSVLESGFFGSAGGIDKEVYRADALVQDACAITLRPDLLKLYTHEWEEKSREEKAKQFEDDALRSSNASLSLKIKTLEERSQQYDTEHVSIASELVHTKVSNQKLIDDNESLQMQVTELQKIVSAQPGEVEQRLQHEMERIMQRNIEVQNANRHLEEQCAETEGELVKAKLQLAETTDEFEALRQKWSSISSMMKNPA